MGGSMNRLSENLWATENPEKLTYAWTGEQCETTVNDFLEEGKGGILDFFLVTSFGHNLNPYKTWEELPRKTFIWEIPEPNEEYWATHFSVGEFKAEITENAVVIESEQSVFYFEKEATDEREGIIGVPENAYKMSNDAFIVLSKSEIREKRETPKIEPKRKERPVKQEVQLKSEIGKKENVLKTKEQNATVSVLPKSTVKLVKDSQQKMSNPIKILPQSTQSTVTTTYKPQVKISTTVMPVTNRISTTTSTTPKPITVQRVVTSTSPPNANDDGHFETISVKRPQNEQIYQAKGREFKNVGNLSESTTTKKPITVTVTKVGTNIPKNLNVSKPVKIHKIESPLVSTATPTKSLTITPKPKNGVKKSNFVPEFKKIVTTTVTTSTVKPMVTSTSVTTVSTKGTQNASEITVLPIGKTNSSLTIGSRINSNIFSGLANVTEIIKSEMGENIETEYESENEIETRTESSWENENERLEEMEMNFVNEEKEGSNEEEYVQFEVLENDRRKRTTVTTPDAQWLKKVEKSKKRGKAGQENKNMNTRVNYAMYRLDEARKQQYDQIYIQAYKSKRGG
ncbi:hypothetical protein niasHT_018413 [Heterodera trifolii]|uniref:Zonadhesin n=1 Tax=Heterodera trifolii TaxID=157864 RepID=A0ABD2KWC1_9BILA